MTFRIREMQERAGVTLREVGEALYPDSTPNTRRVLMTLLFNTPVKTIRLEHVEKLCKVLRCTPSELFDVSENKVS